MNPGGDFGKKELSPALRNRFTEIWCESCTDRDDLIAIIERNVNEGISFGNQQDGSSGIGRNVMDFVEWFKCSEIGKRYVLKNCVYIVTYGYNATFFLFILLRASEDS